MQSNELEQDEIIETDDVGSDIAASIEKLKTPTEEEVVEDAEVVEEHVVEEPIEPVAEEKPKIAPPASYTATVKEKWDSLPPEVQQELVKREEEVHRMMTSPTGELNFGRTMKQTFEPYMPLIQEEGGTPEGAIRDLLNTAYTLRKGTPEQKYAVVKEVCDKFGIQMPGAEEEYVDPTIQNLQQEIARLRQQADPNTLIKQLREQQERDTVQREANAFASDPANKYFEKVRPFMAAFLGEGVAKDYKEAYDMACNAHPEVRSILEAEKKAAEAEKRKAELKAKQNAASSIVGSPATAVSNTNSQTDDVESAVRAAIRASAGTI